MIRMLISERLPYRKEELKVADILQNALGRFWKVEQQLLVGTL
jgi:hypothetical protein